LLWCLAWHGGLKRVDLLRPMSFLTFLFREDTLLLWLC
jgi:hypothetical protein